MYSYKHVAYFFHYDLSYNWYVSLKKCVYKEFWKSPKSQFLLDLMVKCSIILAKNIVKTCLPS
jgi:hypothetical protein